MWRQEGTSHITIDNKAIEDVAMPFPYAKIIERAIGSNAIDNRAIEGTVVHKACQLKLKPSHRWLFDY